ncbi:hypothetical protein [Fangia hongkongensis]|uniref:hypothetical protein n=1 Tax=Fangia hongkongensis TaxID=270495 RepID=UPI00035DA6D9|nr:hypothetical protein [Fangia hongkongensis]MBK2126226.1 hypothetical protein [Fangia hongkongensis]
MESNQLTIYERIIDLINEKSGRQRKEMEFYQHFSYTLIEELNKYMGKKNVVALCPETGGFTFDKEYRSGELNIDLCKHECLIPLMFNFENLILRRRYILKISLEKHLSFYPEYDQSGDISVDDIEKPNYVQTCEHISKDIINYFTTYPEQVIIEDDDLLYNSTTIGLIQSH